MDYWRMCREHGRDFDREFRIQRPCGEVRWVHFRTVPIYSDNQVGGYVGTTEDITERKLAEDQRETLIGQLQEALIEIKTLGRLLPICAGCKKIRDDSGYWNQIESYIAQHTDARFTHSYCPDCASKFLGESGSDHPDSRHLI